jgi:hypothetical protein
MMAATVVHLEQQKALPRRARCLSAKLGDIYLCMRGVRMIPYTAFLKAAQHRLMTKLKA